MIVTLAAHAALLAGMQAASMPPTPEQVARRLVAIPRCVPPPAATAARTGASENRADQAAAGLRRAAERFPIISCKEGSSK